MFNIVLFEPRIPQNAGNIGRLCVATNSILHLVHPLGFHIDEKSVKRAGLDYWDDLHLVEWDNIDTFLENNKDKRIHFLTTKSKKSYFEATFLYEDFIVFGREDAGIDEAILKKYMSGKTRSINLATAVSAVLYEWNSQNLSSD